MQSFVACDLSAAAVVRRWLFVLALPMFALLLGGAALAQDEKGRDGADKAKAEAKDKGKANDSQGDDAHQENIAEKAKKDADEAAKALQEGDFLGAVKASSSLLLSAAIPAIVALLVLVVAYFIASMLSRMASTPVRQRIDETLGKFIGRLVFYLIMVCAVLGVLSYFGIGVSSFAAVLAAAGFAIGLAFQGTLSNFAAGVLLLVFRPFKVGDVINAAGLTAKVFAIDLFTTVFDTFDNRRIVVPNSAITSGTIENITFHRERRIDVNVGVAYSASIQETRDTLTAAAESLKEFLLEGEGRGYQIVLGDLGDSAVQWTVRFWTTADIFWPTKEKLTEAVKTHLDNAGIGIPFPQMDVHLDQVK